MNGDFFLALILLLILGDWLVETTADLLNIRTFKAHPPDELRETFDEATFRKSASYLKEGTRFGIFRDSFFVFLTVIFILVGGFNWVDQWARSFGFGEILTGLVFVGALVLARFILQLPFSIYDTFVIEEKYGFNRTKPATFVGDLIKGLVLAALLGGAVFAGITAFFESMGPSGWVYAWIAVSLFQLLLLFVAPVVLMPLFNKFTPLKEGPLKTEIEKYADHVDFQLEGIYSMDGSRRSSKANAFFTGFGRFRKLALFDTLIEGQTPEELVAVVAHEVGHFKEKHIPKMIALSILTSGILFYVLSLFLEHRGLFSAFRMEEVSVYASLIFIGFLYGPIARLLRVFTNALSRKHEYEADRFSIQTYGKPHALANALRKLSATNLAHLTPHPFKVWLDYTHPPLLARVAAIEKGRKQL